MASRQRPSITKRQKERARQERKEKKAERRTRRQAEKDARPDKPTGMDPDIADIKPGPQPLPWEI